MTEGYRFNGSDYVPERDNARLSFQFERIRDLMLDGQWRTLGEIATITGDPEASISAQLRHLRKERFGGYIVEKEYQGEGLYKYRVNGRHTTEKRCIPTYAYLPFSNSTTTPQ